MLGEFAAQDFTFVCPTEIVAFSDRAKEFEAIGCKVGTAARQQQQQLAGRQAGSRRRYSG